MSSVTHFKIELVHYKNMVDFSYMKIADKDELYLMFSKNRNSLMVKQNRYHTTLCRKPVLLCFGIIFNISDMMPNLVENTYLVCLGIMIEFMVNSPKNVAFVGQITELLKGVNHIQNDRMQHLLVPI